MRIGTGIGTGNSVREVCGEGEAGGGLRYHHQRSWAGWTPVLSLFGGLAININGLSFVSCLYVWD